jgi:hypothetical protein
MMLKDFIYADACRKKQGNAPLCNGIVVHSGRHPTIAPALRRHSPWRHTFCLETKEVIDCNWILPEVKVGKLFLELISIKNKCCKGRKGEEKEMWIMTSNSKQGE